MFAGLRVSEEGLASVAVLGLVAGFVLAVDGLPLGGGVGLPLVTGGKSPLPCALIDVVRPTASAKQNIKLTSCCLCMILTHINSQLTFVERLVRSESLSERNLEYYPLASQCASQASRADK